MTQLLVEINLTQMETIEVYDYYDQPCLFLLIMRYIRKFKKPGFAEVTRFLAYLIIGVTAITSIKN